MLGTELFQSASSDDTMLSPDSFVSEVRTIEREKGGIALSDPSQGINVHDWQCGYVSGTGSIVLTNLTTSVSYTILVGITGVVGLSFAFDANMRPALGYSKADGSSYLYYYDTVTEDYATITLAAGSGSPKLCHDDKRDRMVLSNVTDILVFYIRNNLLYYRLQRERYQTEHQVATLTAGATLVKVGMSTELRILVQVSNGTFISSP